MAWIISLLLITLAAVHGLDHFPNKYVTAKKQATLTCETNDKCVTWTLNNKPLKDGAFGGNIHLNCSTVTVNEVGAPVLGEYVCWSAGKKVSSTFLLQESEDVGNLDSLKCRAKSYDCGFTCKWHKSGQDVARLRLGPDCENKPCQWVNGIEKEGSFHFEVSHTRSPFAEESTMLELNVEALDNFSILKGTKSFYLRDIVKPDSPRIVRCKLDGQQINVSMEPPNSWSSPHSFFSLENEIEYVLRDNGKSERSSSALIPKKISKFRGRCRDSYLLSAWSQWTQWTQWTQCTNVKKGTGKKRNVKCIKCKSVQRCKRGKCKKS